jgi:TetR/AcrR family transcriptional regulator, cholesterol catabolism regulator
VETSESREQLLRVAEELFSERGYTAVTLKDIADKLGVRQAAIYYHMPQGKEQLFVAVTQRMFLRHKAGMEQAIAEAEPRLTTQLAAMARWVMTQPPLGLTRLARSDLPALSQEHAALLGDLGTKALIEPLEKVLQQAYARGEARLVDAQLMASVFLAMLDSVHEVYQHKGIAKEVLARDVVDVLLQGLLRR